MLVGFTLDGSFHAEKNDIFYKAPTSDEWRLLYGNSYVKIEEIKSKEFEKKYAEFEQDILTLTAAASKELEHSEISFGAAVGTMFNAAYYKMSSSKRKQQAELFLSSPDPKTASNVKHVSYINRS